MRASEMIRADIELAQRPRQVWPEGADDADARGREDSKRDERLAIQRASNTATAWLGLLVVVSTAAVFYGATAACIRHFL